MLPARFSASVPQMNMNLKVALASYRMEFRVRRVKLAMWLAQCCPRRAAYYIANAVVADATMNCPALRKQEVPAVTAVAVLNYAGERAGL